MRREKSGQGGMGRVKGGTLAVGFQGVTLRTSGRPSFFMSVQASCSRAAANVDRHPFLPAVVQ